MILTRYTLAALAGPLAASFLLWLMQLLVTPPQGLATGSERPRLIEFVRVEREQRLQLRERKPPPPPEPFRTPPRPSQALAPVTRPPAPALNMSMSMNLNLPVNFGDGPWLGPALAQADRDFMVISRQPPQYPVRAARRGIEGWVKVSLSITASGSVENVEVLDSDPPGVFDQAAVQAVQRWRFKPRMINGQASAAKAEQLVEFKLGD